MKKLLTTLTIALTIGSANALPTMRPNGNMPINNQMNNMYNIGYNDGKSHAYDRAAKAAVIVGVAVIAGVIIYQFGKESNWTTNEKGVVYKF